MIFDGSDPRLSVGRATRPCMRGCVQGLLEREDGSVYDCDTCRGTGYTDLPVPKSRVRGSGGSAKRREPDAAARDAKRRLTAYAIPCGLALLLQACTAAPPAKLGIGTPCQGARYGCLPPYPATDWVMSLYEVGTRRTVAYRAGVFGSLTDCHDAGRGLGNPDIYAVCRPDGGGA